MLFYWVVPADYSTTILVEKATCDEVKQLNIFISILLIYKDAKTYLTTM